jgi:large subunit ribosomal protein L17
MRHRWGGRKLGRTSTHKRALMRTMVTEFLENEKIVTTVPKAKELRSVAEKMITLGKRETLHARRQALSFIRKKSVVFKLFDSLAPRFADRNGGYTRILRLGTRVGDAAELAMIELVEGSAKPEKKDEGKKAKPKAAPKSGKTKKTAAAKEATKAGEAKPARAARKSKKKEQAEAPEE